MIHTNKKIILHREFDTDDAIGKLVYEDSTVYYFRDLDFASGEYFIGLQIDNSGNGNVEVVDIVAEFWVIEQIPEYKEIKGF